MNSYMQRGYNALKLRNSAEAAQWFEKALDDNPEDAHAMACLGHALCCKGQRDGGILHIRQAGMLYLNDARKSGNINLLLDLIAQLQQWSDFPGALALCSEAVRINDSEFRGFQLLTVTYAQLNKKAEAINAGRQALALSPENSMMQILLGSLEADAGINDSARQRLEQVLSCRLEAREEFRAHKELARVLDKLGEYDKVFAHLHASDRLSRSLPEYVNQDAALIPNMLKTNRAGFDRELLDRWSGSDFPSDRPAPVFLIGFMRSGTTLTQEVLGAHPDLFLADEADFIWAMQRELNRVDGSNISMAEKLRKLDHSGIMHLRKFYWDRVRGRFGDQIGHKLFLDKFTMNTIDIGLINTVFPDAKVVFVMRDPRDVCLSCFMQLMVPTPATVHLLSWQGTAEFYAQVMNWWMYIKQQMTMDFIEFRYEDATTDFEPTYRKVFDFLGLNWDPGVADFHKHAAKKHIASPSRNQVSQPLYSSSVARWRHYESEFAPIEVMLRPFISAFKYDQLD